MEKHISCKNLLLTHFFGKLGKTEWVTGIEIGDQREAEIQACFSNKVEFHLAKTSEKLTELIAKFKLRTRDVVTNIVTNSGFAERISMDCVIVMGDVSGITGSSKKIEEFLTACRKYRYHCVYNFS